MVMLVNIDPILGFILEIQSIPNYLDEQTVSAMCFIIGHLFVKDGQKQG